MTELSQKYDFLLRPIKDLTKNWNVDIAAVLEDFHEEVEKMTFSFDGGKTQLNFAEAAFLIQGTACVWSRKVESLHNLVYQTLEMVMSSRHNKQPSSIDPLGVDTDATFDNHEDKLLNLDDVRNTNLKKMSNIGEDVVCISLRCPFLQHSEDNRGSPFLNQNGEVSNYYHDFWSNNVVPQTRGSVLLECRIDDEMNKAAAHQDIPNDENEVEDVPAFDNSVRDAPADDFLEDMDACNDESVVVDVTLSKAVQESAYQIEEFQRNLRPRNQQPASAETQEAPTPSNAPLDPHTECTDWVPKPFRKGNTIKYPASIQSNPKKRKATPPVLSVPLISDFLNACKISSATETNSLRSEKIRRQQLWKKLVPNKPERRATSGIEQEREADIFQKEDDDIGDFGGDVDLSDVDDLINDVTLGGRLPSEDHQQADDFHDLDTYEDLVRHHVELFYSSAKRFVQESALTQRVRDWQDTIDPFIAEQDDRPEFDIHKYGDDIINHISIIGDEKSFGGFVKDEAKWEMCRHFAATLQLANDRNVQLSSQSENHTNCVNTLQIKLLSRHRPKDKIADYVPI